MDHFFTNVTFASNDRGQILVNRYFLLIYNQFFREILETHHYIPDLVFIFEEISFGELENLKNDIHTKHFNCTSLHSLENDVDNINPDKHKSNDDKERKEEYFEKDDPKMDISKAKTDIDMNEANVVRNDQSDKMQEHESNDNWNTGNNHVKCPFKCSEEDWVPDKLFAHICINHVDQVDKDYSLSNERFLKLKSEISRKCIFNCNIKVETCAMLNAHYKSKHTEKPQVCDHCGKTFANYIRLRDHKSRYRTNEVTCEACGKICKNNIKLRVHIKLVHAERRFQCQIGECQVSCPASQDLKRHIESVHVKSKPWICDLCGIRMSQFGNLRDHRHKVHGEKYSGVQHYKTIIKDGKHPFITGK